MRIDPLRSAATLVAAAVVAIGVAGFVAYFTGETRPLLTAQGPLALRPEVAGELALFFDQAIIRSGQIAVHLLGVLVFWTTGIAILWRGGRGVMPAVTGVTLVLLGVALFSPVSLLQGGLSGVSGVVGTLRPGPEVWRSLTGVAVIWFALVFPDGRPLGRWSALAVGAVTAQVVIWSLAPGSVADPRTWPGAGAVAWTVAVALGVVVLVVVRFFRTPETDRRPIAPVVVALSATVLSILLFALLQPRLHDGLFDLVLATPRIEALHDLNLLLFLTVSLLLLPLAVGVAVIRYRLWDIQLLVNQALVYGALTAVVAGSFLVGMVGLGSVFASFVGGGRAVAGVMTGIVLVLVFQPVRRRIQSAVDRRFYRDKYDAERAVDAFVRAVAEVVDAGQVEQAVAEVVDRTVHPESVRLVVGERSGIPHRVAAIDRDEDTGYDGAWPSDARLLVPLVNQGRAIGGLFLGPRRSGGPYTALDRDLLERVAAAAAPAVKVAQLVEEQERQAVERARIESEMAVARTIQRDLLPHTLPEIPGWRFASVYESAFEVGGDYYDVIAMPGGKVALLVADVSGKGVPAAMLMATCRAVIRSLADAGTDPAALLSAANRRLAGDIRPGMFITCFLAVLDPSSGHLAFANAGHTLPAIRWADGTVDDLRATGMPFGWFPDAVYESITIDLGPGTMVVIPSDGVIEARSPGGEFFGVAGFHEVVGGHSDSTVVDAILHRLRDHCAPSDDLGDDVTMLALARL